MLIGYARVSTRDQNLALQRDALEAAGCNQIFEDHGISGTHTDRPAYIEAMSTLQDGDTLVVWRLDRLSRSLFDLVETLQIMKERGIAFRSICEGMDTASPYGEAIYAIASAFAHLERNLIAERTRAGIAAAKARGVEFGRRPALKDKELQEALFLRAQGVTIQTIANRLGVGRSTLYRHLRCLALSGLEAPGFN